MAGNNQPGAGDAERDEWRYDPPAAQAQPLPARFDVWGRPPSRTEPDLTALADSPAPVWGEPEPPPGSTSAGGWPAKSAGTWNAFGAAPPVPSRAEPWPEEMPPAEDPWIDATVAIEPPRRTRPEPSAPPLQPSWEDRTTPPSSYAPSAPVSFAAANGTAAPPAPQRVAAPPLTPPPPLGSVGSGNPLGSGLMGQPAMGRPPAGSMGQPSAVPQAPGWPPPDDGDAVAPLWPPGEHGLGHLESDGMPTGPRRRAKSRTPKVLGAVLAIILLAIVVVVVRGRGPVVDAAGTNSASASGGPTTGAPTSIDPFAGTPASSYAQGDAGITLPPGTAVAGFTVAQVDAGLRQVKLALIASRLDPAMLMSHDPTPLVKLLSPQAGKDIKPFFDSQKFFGFATQIAPGSTLSAEKVRVSGKVTFKASTVGGVRRLDVVTNFVWVYPFAGALTQAGDHLVVVHDQVTWAIPVESDVDKDYRGLNISDWKGFASNMDCESFKKSLLALGKPQVVTAGTGAEEKSMFDPGHSLDVPNTC